MYVDNNLLVSGSISGSTITGQTVTGASAVLSTNTIDLLQARDIGEGADTFGRFEVTTAFTGLTALEMQVVIADDAALSTNLTVIGTTGAIPVASLTAGARFACDINPRIASKGQRYMGCRYVPTGTGTAGALLGDIGAEIQDGQKFYPAGFAVL
jgi:hypothetical protein